MSGALGTIARLQAGYVALQTLIDVFSIVLRRRTGGKVGMTPENPYVNLLLLATLVVILGNTDANASKHTAYGVICLLLTFQAVFSVLSHLGQYFKYKAQLRRAKIKYEQTGEKSDISMGEYRSLNTLMLAVLSRVYGLFAAGAGVYFAFVGFPEIAPGSAEEQVIDLEWK